MALLTEAQAINGDVYYCEKEGGLEITVTERNPMGLKSGENTFVIPWIKLRQSLARKDKKKVPKDDPIKEVVTS